MSGRDELLPYLTPIPSLLDDWDGQDPYDLFSREQREQILAKLDEIAACRRRALAAALTAPLGR
jgi:hypothetical protein